MQCIPLGYENDSVEDLKEMTAVSSRKRGKQRYFWEYSEQLTPLQQDRTLRPSEWSRDTLPSNMYQKNGLHHGKNRVLVLSECLGSDTFSSQIPILASAEKSCVDNEYKSLKYCKSVAELAEFCTVSKEGTVSIQQELPVWFLPEEGE